MNPTPTNPPANGAQRISAENQPHTVFTELEAKLSERGRYALWAYQAAFKNIDQTMTVTSIKAAIRQLYGNAAADELEQHLDARVNIVLPQPTAPTVQPEPVDEAHAILGDADPRFNHIPINPAPSTETPLSERITQALSFESGALRWLQEHAELRNLLLDCRVEANAHAETVAKLEEATKSLVIWQDGFPVKPYTEKWFLARLKNGDKVVLTALPDEWSYDFKTADETYLKKENVVKWAQFPTSEYKTPLEEAEAKLTAAEQQTTKDRDEWVLIASENGRLREQVAELTRERDELRLQNSTAYAGWNKAESDLATARRDTERYNELIYAVATKHDNETRHETALRYIREREARVDGPCEARA